LLVRHIKLRNPKHLVTGHGRWPGSWRKTARRARQICAGLLHAGQLTLVRLLSISVNLEMRMLRTECDKLANL